MRYIISFLTIILMAGIIAQAASVSITIFGTNKTNADANVTCYGCNNTVEVQAWNTTYSKNFTVESRNGSGGDVITFNISNITGYQIQELKANGTSIDGYQAGANGMLNFTYTVIGNRTLTLSPAVNVGGYNSTWGWFWNLTAYNRVGILTQTPQKALTIGTGDDPVQTTQGMYITAATADVGIVIRDSTVDVEGFLGAFDSGFTEDEFVLATRSGHDLVFGTTNTERMRLDSGGGITVLGNFLVSNGVLNTTASNHTNYTAALDTVYYNSYGTKIFVNFQTFKAGAGSDKVNAYSDYTTNPTDGVATYGSYLGNGGTLSFTVLPRGYYKVNNTGADAHTSATYFRVITT